MSKSVKLWILEIWNFYFLSVRRWIFFQETFLETFVFNIFPFSVGSCFFFSTPTQQFTAHSQRFQRKTRQSCFYTKLMVVFVHTFTFAHDFVGASQLQLSFSQRRTFLKSDSRVKHFFCKEKLKILAQTNIFPCGSRNNRRDLPQENFHVEIERFMRI